MNQLDSVQKVRAVQRDSLGRSHGVGKYKTSVARVFLYPGEQNRLVNSKDPDVYFRSITQRLTINQPFEVLESKGMTYFSTAMGGGLSSQAKALRLAIANALVKYDPSNHRPLKERGLLTYINRPVERKKPGQPKSRKNKPTSRR